MEEPSIISRLRLGTKVKIRATITSLHSYRIKNGNLMTIAGVGDESGSTFCVWFSKAPLKNLRVGNEYLFEGMLEHKYGKTALQKPKYTLTAEKQQVYTPVEPITPYASMNSQAKKSGASSDQMVAIFWGLVICAVATYFLISWVRTTTQNNEIRAHNGGVTCKDVTSYDYNWNNDVLCTRADGSTFYTNYAGGNKYGYDF